jgi:hypothetical protein
MTSLANFAVEPVLPPDDVLDPSSGGSDSEAVALGEESPLDAVWDGVDCSVGVSVGVSVGTGLTVAVAFDSAAAATGGGVDVGGDVCHGQ